MVNSRDILETINMIDNEHLDVRTITMGISLLDCIDSNIQTACTKVYDKICRYAKDLVKTGEDISKEYGIPIINKRICLFFREHWLYKSGYQHGCCSQNGQSDTQSSRADC